MKLFRLMLLSLFFIFLTGCTQQSYILRVLEDDKVDLTASITMSDKTLQQLKDYELDTNMFHLDPTAVFDRLVEQYEANGFLVTNISDNVTSGVSLKKTYATIDEFNKETQQLYESGLSGLNMVITKDSGILKTDYKFSGSLEYVVDKDLYTYIDQFPAWRDYVPIGDMSANITVGTQLGNVTLHENAEIQNNQGYWSARFDSEASPLIDQSPNNVRILYSSENILLKTGLFIVGFIVLVAGLVVVLSSKNNQNEPK